MWHYQTTPADNWDYTATQQLVLADLTIDGEMRKVIMQAPKNGFFYVLDRRTGELLSAEKFARASWASHVDIKTGRPVETKYADYQSNGGSYIWPAPLGAHNWQPMSYSTRTGLMYIPVINSPFFYAGQPSVDYKINRWNVGIDLNEGRDPKNWVAAKAGIDALAYGELVAWDPIKKQRAWSVRQKMPSNGGVLSTAADLVFQGTWDGTFAAYDARSGENLWQYRSDSAVMAGPITYELEGEQYIAVAQGGGGSVMLGHGEDLKRNKINNNRLLVFKLGNFGLKSPVVDQSLATIPPLNRTFNSNANTIKKGETIYGRNCSFCHSVSAKSNYIVPDLRYMSEQTHNEFTAIVLGGSRSHKGMIGFYETLDFEDVEAVHAYLAHQQQLLPEKVEMSFWQKIEYWFYYFTTKIAAKFPDLLNASRDMLMQ